MSSQFRGAVHHCAGIRAAGPGSSWSDYIQNESDEYMHVSHLHLSSLGSSARGMVQPTIKVGLST